MVYEHAVDPPNADDPDAIREFTQRCTDVLEMYVRRYPGLWLWMHRRWRDVDPESVRGMFPAATRDDERREAHLTDVRRLIVRAPNWLGDAVMALPALEAVRRAYADATIILAARPSVAPFFEEDTPAKPDDVLVVDAAHEATQLRDARADAILLLPNSFGSAWIASRAGIPERWGYRAGGRGWMLTRGVGRPAGRVHQVAVLPVAGARTRHRGARCADPV